MKYHRNVLLYTDLRLGHALLKRYSLCDSVVPFANCRLVGLLTASEVVPIYSFTCVDPCDRKQERSPPHSASITFLLAFLVLALLIAVARARLLALLCFLRTVLLHLFHAHVVLLSLDRLL